MQKYEIKIRANAYATVVVEAPTPETAIEFLSENLNAYGLDFEVDEMDAEVDAGIYTDKCGNDALIGKAYGAVEVTSHPDVDADYTVDTEWLEANGYEVVTTIRKRETV